MRLLLGCVALIVFLADAWWVFDRRSKEEQQFNVFTTQTAVKFSDQTNFPLYDPATSTWRLNGKRIASLQPFIQNWNESPDGIGRFVVVRIGEPESLNNVQDALLALIDQGICQAGLIDKASRDQSGVRQVSVLKIDWARAGDGTKRKCISKDR